jgi:hypothetical protein
MKYYTIFKDGKLYTDVLGDDMNSGELWGEGGMIYTSKKKALALLKYKKKNAVFWFDKSKYEVIEMTVKKI